MRVGSSRAQASRAWGARCSRRPPMPVTTTGHPAAIPGSGGPRHWPCGLVGLMEERAAAAPRTASVVISCYNYGQYVARAIESALEQTHAVEVIVVDDGSTDDSPSIIAGYGDRVRAITKTNGGQASVFNLACRLATGDAIFLLDADDELRPDAVETILTLWSPEAVLVQWRPSVMNVDGSDLPGSVPAPWTRLAEGDVREQLLASGGFAVTVTSGLAVRRDAILRILPVPEPEFRLGADGYVVRALAFLGPLQAVDQPLSRYRLHGANMIGGSPENIAATCRKYIAWARHEFDAVKSLAAQHGLTASPDVGEQNAEYLRFRLYSLVMEPEHHPIPGDSKASLIGRLIRAQGHPDAPYGRRLLTLLLDMLAGFVPRAVGWRVLAWWYGLREMSRLSASPRTGPGWIARVLVSESLREMSAGPENAGTALSQDTRVALRNAATLAVSLVGTWTVGLIVRLWLPRHLGPENFGLLSFAEGLASTVLGSAGLGF
jgi:hypothetical protein